MVHVMLDHASMHYKLNGLLLIVPVIPFRHDVLTAVS